MEFRGAEPQSDDLFHSMEEVMFTSSHGDINNVDVTFNLPHSLVVPIRPRVRQSRLIRGH
jgi:hypothetical protein